MMIRQLAHACFFTDRMDQMIDFYTRQLGLKIKFTMENKENQTFGYYFECGQSTFIEVFDQALAIKEWGGQVGPMANRAYYQHFCFEVIDLAGFRQELINRGLEVTEITEGLDFSRQAWMKDPDGNAIEIMEYTTRSLQLKS